jgi:hypothetical protein
VARQGQNSKSTKSTTQEQCRTTDCSGSPINTAPAEPEALGCKNKMMNSSRLQRIALANESVIENRFKRLNYKTKRLDLHGPKSRPDFLIFDASGPQLICEVKTVFSTGFISGRNAHISTHDPKLLDTGTFHNQIDFRKIDDNLFDAVRKYRCLIDDCPEFEVLPFAVAFFFDFFADYFDYYPRRMDRFPEVSGILKIVEDRAIEQIARKMTSVELERRIKASDLSGLPPSSKDFLLVENQCANLRLPRHFVMDCILQ